MADPLPQPRMSEPEVVDCHFIEGFRLEIRDEVVRLVGWVDLETVANFQPERRIVVRAAMTKTVARALIADLRRSLVRREH